MFEMEVFCKNCGRLSNHSESVTSENIEEDGLGRDVVTFFCHLCKTEQKSFVFMRR